jgi:UDP-3-O-[3-hydroxymyristoyl] glucosamine N-acyltransferase
MSHVGEGARIGPNVFVGKDVLIDDGTLVGTSAVIQSGAKIGKNCRIHEFAFIGHNSVLGDGCEIHPHAAVGTEGFGYASDNKGQHHPIPHRGHVELGKRVHVGSGTKIDRGTFGKTSIGDDTKIDNLCHISHNCKIGKSALITAGFIVAGSTTIGDNFVSGGRVTVTGHMNIVDNVYLAGASIAHKSISKAGQYFGYPLKPLKEGLKNNAAYGNLAKMKKTLSKVVKHLDLKIDE